MSNPYEGDSTSSNIPGLMGNNTAAGGRGVVGNGFTATGIGVLGQNGAGDAVFGNSGSGRGVVGLSTSQAGVVGESQTFDGVFGISHNPNAAGVSGHSLDHNGKVIPGGLAGYFDGNVTINGNLTMGSGGDIILSDFAEDFDIADAAVEPGTVMTIDQDGALRASNHAYDKSVAGVVSGAGDYRPAIILDKQAQTGNRRPIALVGKVYCNVDAGYSPIEVGDLLTTSSTPGHAMKAADPLKALGAVIGKALGSLEAGQGLIPILIALQ